MAIIKKCARTLDWLPVLGWAFFIFWLSSKSDVPTPGFWLPPFTDKLIHATLYAILAGSIYRAVKSPQANPWRSALIAVALASLYGVSDEWHQTMVANRTADVADWIADTVGASFVFLIARREVKQLGKIDLIT